MNIKVKTRAVQKAGNLPSEIEDACYPVDDREVEARYFRAAVADGATETSFADLWARELVLAYARGRLDRPFKDDPLRSSRRRWAARTGSHTLPWYAEEKRRLGAYSSLLGLTIRSTRRWDVKVVGDSCLFQIRSGSLLRALPLNRSQQFNNRPRLISSLHDQNSRSEPVLQKCSGHWSPGDAFFLMTDAVACWFLHSVENNAKPWVDLYASMDDATVETPRFPAFVDDLRARGELRNDDVAVISIEVS